MPTVYRLVQQTSGSIGPFVTAGYVFASDEEYTVRCEAEDDACWYTADERKFHVATIRDGMLVAFAWAEEDWVDGNANLDSIAQHLGLKVGKP
jgi:hypothetical protein